MRTANFLIFVLLTSVMSYPSQAAVTVGEVAFSRGVLTGQQDGSNPRIIGKGVRLHNGETLNTGSRGFALIKLKDGTRMTLRPNTTFKIENVNTKKNNENILLSLFRGGLRAITGFISKSKPDAFRINTKVATIGIRGTEFDARLCAAKECDQEEKASGKKASNESRVVGRIAVLKGKASATEDRKKSRALSVGAAVYERDQIQTGISSFAVIAFDDKTRVTMSPKSVFRIEEHQYKPEQPAENNSFFSFLQGGLRLITGAIGKLNRKAFRIGTPIATIGIRGTGFDLVCAGECVSSNALRDPVRDTVLGELLSFFLKPVFASRNDNGMYARVWNGAIVLRLGNDSVLLNNGKTAFLKNKLSAPVIVPDIPIGLRNLGGAPRPDKVKVNKDLFSTIEQKDIKPGLYVNVRKGDVAIEGTDGKTINLGAGEAGVAGARKTARLRVVPAFQKFDRVPDPSKITAKSEKMINMLGKKGADKKGLECVIQ